MPFADYFEKFRVFLKLLNRAGSVAVQPAVCTGARWRLIAKLCRVTGSLRGIECDVFEC